MANARSIMQRRAFIFRRLAIISFIASFIAFYLYVFTPTALVFRSELNWLAYLIPTGIVYYASPNFLVNLAPVDITVLIWGLVGALLFSFISWRNEVAIKESLRHEEVMEGLKVIYNFLGGP